MKRFLYPLGAVLVLAGVVLMCFAPTADEDDDRRRKPETPPVPPPAPRHARRFSFPIEESAN